MICLPSYFKAHSDHYKYSEVKNVLCFAFTKKFQLHKITFSQSYNIIIIIIIIIILIKIIRKKKEIHIRM